MADFVGTRHNVRVIREQSTARSNNKKRLE